ncbi:MAG TPA: FtsX-like permease family protein, partial [Gemmatimonadaceae bacterium]|nr:FtsX-like permease family protein [Gemmatimonadaceae bacterium]
GVRVALGATNRQIMRLVLGKGVGLAAVGTVFGLSTALVVTRFLRSMLYDVEPTDPLTLVAIVIMLMISVIAATWVPARRATGVPVVEALRGS